MRTLPGNHPRMHHALDSLPTPWTPSVIPVTQLTGTELHDWIALRRVYEGGVVMLGSQHLDHGRKVPCYLPEAFRRLADTELTELHDSDSPGELRRVVITPLGRARYQELSAKHCPAPYPGGSASAGIAR